MTWAWFVATAGAAEAQSTAASGGLTMFPAMYTVREVPLGREVVLDILGTPGFTVENNSDGFCYYELRATGPREAGMPTWERGFEPIPESSWLRVDQQIIGVAPHARKLVKVYINIPDKAEFYNRHWVACVQLTSLSVPSISARLALCARIHIETKVRGDTDGFEAGALSLTPACVSFSDFEAGDKLQAVVKVRNNTVEEGVYVIRRLRDIYPGDRSRDRRYLSPGYQWAGDWSQFNVDQFKLARGKTFTLNLEGQIPADAQPDSLYEELIFIGSQDVLDRLDQYDRHSDGPSIPSQPEMSFIRIRYQMR